MGFLAQDGFIHYLEVGGGCRLGWQVSLGHMSPTGSPQVLDTVLVKGSQEQQQKTTSTYNCLSDLCVTFGNVPNRSTWPNPRSV